MYNEIYDDCIVVFFDILGFRFLVSEEHTNPEYILELLETLRQKAPSKNPLPTGSNIRGIAFSDSFVRVVSQGSAPNVRILLLSELIFIEDLQRKIIRDFDLPIRGAITLGKIFIDNGIVFGPALVRAVELAEKATYGMPCILLDHNIINLIDFKNAQAKSLKDTNICVNISELPEYFVNYFNIRSLITPINGYQDELSFLNKHRAFILENIKRFESNTNIVEKYKWLAWYHNKEIQKIPEYEHLKFDITPYLITDQDVSSIEEIDSKNLLPWE
jgi:hypothetical protein